MSDQETLNVYDARAAQYADLTKGSDGPDTQLQHFLDALAPGAELLDLGCGPGQAAAFMAAAGHTVTATDASTEMVKRAGALPGVTARQATFDEISGDGIYDGVWANFSLLHAPRSALPTHLSAIATSLKPGGLFHIGMKTGENSKRDSIGRLYTYVTPDELTQLLTDAGLRPFQEWTGEQVGLDGTMAPWIVLQARKHD